MEYHKNSEGRERGYHLLLMAAVEEPGWGLLQEEADVDARLRSDRVCRGE